MPNERVSSLLSQESTSLLTKAKTLVNEEYRALKNITNRNDSVQSASKAAAAATNSNVKTRPESVKDARRRIRKEWDELINSSRPLDDSISHLLIGAVVYIEIDSVTDVESLKLDLLSMGATVVPTFAKEVTHIVFKNGRLETYKRAKLMNVHLVSALWVEACKTSKIRMNEKLYPVYERNEYSNSPRIFRKYLEFEGKHFEYDEIRGTLIRKTQKKLPSIISDMQNLNIACENVPAMIETSDVSVEKPTSSTNDNSSSNSVTMHYTPDDTPERDDDVSGRQSSEDQGIAAHSTNIDKSTTVKRTSPRKRKLFSKYPRQASYIVCTPENVTQETPSTVNARSRPKIINSNTYVKKPEAKVRSAENKNKTKSAPITLPVRPLNNVHKRISSQINYKKPSLVGTFLHSDEHRNLKDIVLQLGIFELKTSVDETTTHVVAGEPKRTINLLKGIARGCWIVSKEWLKKSYSVGHWVSESCYELTEFSRVVRRSRMEKQALGKAFKLNIFDDCGPMYVSRNCDPPFRDLYLLIRLCSGVVVRNIEASKIVIGEYSEEKICVSEKWILDSITCGRYKTISKYFIHSPVSTS